MTGSDLTAVSGTLHQLFDADLGVRTVDSEIRRVTQQFSDAKIRVFVPLFVNRYAGQALRTQQRVQRQSWAELARTHLLTDPPHTLHV